MKNKKIAALLSIALLISLTGCGGNSAENDVPPSNSIEATQTPSESPETAPGATESTSQTQDPPQSEEPTIEPAQEPTAAQTEEPKEQVTPSKEPTPEPTQEPTTPPATPASVNTPAPTPAPTPTPAPVHTHSYTTTKKATCTSEGIETCSCGDTKVIPATGQHDYQPQTIQGTGHFEQVQVGTEQVIVRYETRLRSVCTTCGFETYDTNELREHQRATCFGGRQLCYEEKTPIYEEQPKYENQWVIDTPDQIIYKCSVCGQEKP